MAKEEEVVFTMGSDLQDLAQSVRRVAEEVRDGCFAAFQVLGVAQPSCPPTRVAPDRVGLLGAVYDDLVMTMCDLELLREAVAQLAGVVQHDQRPRGDGAVKAGR